MSTNLYSAAQIYINGAKLGEAQSVKVSRVSAAQEIATLGRGFAGVSQGARKISVSVESAVPSAGFELDPSAFIFGLTVVELTIFAAGKTLTSRGFILDDNFQSAVNSPSQLSFDFIGEWSNWSS